MTEQEWHSATAVAKAYHIGKSESGAVSALLSGVSPIAFVALQDSVKIRGMSRFLTHDSISRGIFSLGFSSGVANAEAWKDQLTNAEDSELDIRLRQDFVLFSIFLVATFFLEVFFVECWSLLFESLLSCFQVAHLLMLSSYHSSDEVLLLLWRLEHDHDACVPELRKAVTFKDALRVHQSCGAFLHFIKLLRDLAPESDFPAMHDGLKSQLKLGYLDADFAHILDTTVPPGDPAAVGSFRRPLGSLMYDFSFLI